jgi:hypothetical protein
MNSSTFHESRPDRHAHTHTHTRARARARTQFKMADDVSQKIENALNTIVNLTDKSGNLKKELKTSIHETVSNLRKLFFYTQK